MALFVAINTKYVHTSLAVRYLRNAAGENADIYEGTINDSVFSIASDIFKTGKKHIFFACYIWNIEFVLKVCEILKKADSSILLTLGGPEAGYNADALLEENWFIDHIIRGEGETKIKEFVLNPPGRGIYDFGAATDLDKIPFAYEADELRELSDRLVYYETSRGCPFNCAFCLSSAEKGVRFRSVELVKKELLMFIKNGVKLVKLVDRTFNADNKRALEIVEFIKKNSQNTSFHFEVKAETMTEELIESLAESPKGLFQLEIGVQSTDPGTLARINRHESFERLTKTVKKLSKNKNMHLHLDLIAGLPNESFERLKKSFNDVFELRPDDLQLGFLKKLYGTEINAEDGKFSSFPPYEVVSTNAISYGELLVLKDVSACVEKVYNSGAFCRTVDALVREYETPFDMFFELSKFHDFSKSVSQKSIYEILLNFSKEIFGDERLKDALVFDFCLSNRDYLSFMEKSDSIKKSAFEFLKNDLLVERFFPEYIDLKPTERYKKIRFEKIGKEVYAFDPLQKKVCTVTKDFDD